MPAKNYSITPTPVKELLLSDSRIKVCYDDESFSVEVDGFYIGVAGSYWDGIDMGRSHIQRISCLNRSNNHNTR